MFVIPLWVSLLFTIFSSTFKKKKKTRILAQNFIYINTISIYRSNSLNSSSSSQNCSLKFFFLLFLKSFNSILNFFTLFLFLIWVGSLFQNCITLQKWSPILTACVETTRNFMLMLKSFFFSSEWHFSTWKEKA